MPLCSNFECKLCASAPLLTERLQLGFLYKWFGIHLGMAGCWAEHRAAFEVKFIQKSPNTLLTNCNQEVRRDCQSISSFPKPLAPPLRAECHFERTGKPKVCCLIVYHTLKYEALILFCNQEKQNIIYKRNYHKRSILRSDGCTPARRRRSFQAWWINTLISVPTVETYGFLESGKGYKPGVGSPEAVGRLAAQLCGSC